jgi:hypothetical protein
VQLRLGVRRPRRSPPAAHRDLSQGSVKNVKASGLLSVRNRSAESPQNVREQPTRLDACKR